jgi:hypothetical protein
MESPQTAGIGQVLATISEEYDTLTLTFEDGSVLYVSAHPEDPDCVAFLLSNWEIKA